MEHINCSLCGTNKADLVFKRKDMAYNISDVYFSIVRCRKCGLVYVNPRPTEEEIKGYYTNEFYDVQADRERLLKDKKEQLLLKYDFVKDFSPGKMLDIGCQKGEFMYFMRQKGWEVRGVEFSSRPPNLFDLDIFYGDISSAGYPDGVFDMVTLWAVLEHAYKPKEMLKDVNRILKPGGVVVMLVTNFNSPAASFMRHDDIPRHTTLFTEKTIKRMLHLAGFSSERIYFEHRLFGGGNRGLLNYLFKMAAGENIEEIVEQNRTVTRWPEFSSKIKGVESRLMMKIDKADISIAPYLSRILDKLRMGFIMIARAIKK